MTQPQPSLAPSNELIEELEKAGKKLAEAHREVKMVVLGQDEAVTLTLTSLVSGGHILLVGLPGLAKTKLVTVMAKVLGLDTKRVQCTPDLMPSDIVGAEVLEEVDYGRRNFRFIQGPVFTQMLMVDEINRASPRTQSALLQAMQEKQVTVMGKEHNLPSPFLVLATQNPLEQDGVYPLPEAQRDRFMIQLDIGYPSAETEHLILRQMTAENDYIPKTIIYANDLLAMHKLVRQMPFSDMLSEALVAFLRNGRPETTKLDIVRNYVSWGPGPRAGQAFSLATRARALIDGRFAPTMSDIIALTKPILQHRMELNFKARSDGVTCDDVIKAMVATLPKG